MMKLTVPFGKKTFDCIALIDKIFTQGPGTYAVMFVYCNEVWDLRMILICCCISEMYAKLLYGLCLASIFHATFMLIVVLSEIMAILLSWDYLLYHFLPLFSCRNDPCFSWQPDIGLNLPRRFDFAIPCNSLETSSSLPIYLHHLVLFYDLLQ